jgi:hypothetical protein
VERLAREETRRATVRDWAVRGGHGAALTEFGHYQLLLERNALLIPDIAVVAIDSNCHPHARAVREIEAQIRPVLSGRAVTACPDPHVERWYLADVQSFLHVVGASPRLPRKKKCGKDLYKGVLAQAVRDGGYPPTLGGIEFAQEIVDAMDLDRAAKNDRALGRFISDFRAAIKAAQG